MLDTVQHASFLMDSFGLLRRWSKHGSAEQFKITWDDNHKTAYQMTRFTFNIHESMKTQCEGISSYCDGVSPYLCLDVISCYDVAHRT